MHCYLFCLCEDEPHIELSNWTLTFFLFSRIDVDALCSDRASQGVKVQAHLQLCLHDKVVGWATEVVRSDTEGLKRFTFSVSLNFMITFTCSGPCSPSMKKVLTCVWNNPQPIMICHCSTGKRVTIVPLVSSREELEESVAYCSVLWMRIASNNMAIAVYEIFIKVSRGDSEELMRICCSHSTAQEIASSGCELVNYSIWGR